MKAHDVEDAERLTDEAFYRLDARTATADFPRPQRRPPERVQLWRERALHLLEHDGPGCWVAEDDAGLLGVSVSLRREGLWGLSSYAVHPRGQNAGAGRAVLEASLKYSEGCLRGLICSSSDPRAARRYRLAGFTLHPAMTLWGRVDRSALPVVEHLREGTAADIDLLDSLDRLTRGAAHGVDHEVLVRQLRLVVVDRAKGSGYCYVGRGGGAYLLAASNRRTAQMLLWEALASSAEQGPGPRVDHLTGEQEWAVDVGLAAGLQLHNNGYVALRHMKPPMPYLPSGHFL
jgi:GNAT superfamily N-acetyltransferase